MKNRIVITCSGEGYQVDREQSSGVIWYKVDGFATLDLTLAAPSMFFGKKSKRKLVPRTWYDPNMFKVMPFWDQYPNLRDLIVSIAANNGVINRLEPVESVFFSGRQALEADGVITNDIRMLEDWLATLSQGELGVLAGGEQEEWIQLASMPPMSHLGSQTVAHLLTDIYEAIAA